MSGAQRILDGLEDAKAWAAGDDSRATLHVPQQKLTAEELHEKSKAAAEAFVKACEDAAEAMARAILPLAKMAKDQDMPKELAAGALTGMMAAMESGSTRVEAAMDKVAKEMGIEL
jgi:hypothetical protein